MLEKIEKWFRWILLAPAILPIVYIDGFLYPYLAPKTLLFRGLFIIAAAVFVYLFFSRAAFYWARLRHRATWLPGTLLIVAYITSLIGIDFYHSFWSVFNRGDGLITLTAVVSFFYFILLSADKNFLQKLFSITAWAGSLVALYGILQWFQGVLGIDIPLIAEPHGRLGATLGNAAFLAAYLGMSFFATLSVWKDYRGGWLRLLQVGAVLQLIAIILSATRGTILAFVIVGLCAAVYVALRGERKVRSYARWGILVAIALGVLFIVFRGPLSHAPFEPVQRIASVSLSDSTVSSRLFVWQSVLGETLKRPLTGYGAEHIEMLFNRVYDPSAIEEEWFDRTHNAYLDYFAQYGIGGLLLYLSLIFTLFFYGKRLWDAHDEYGLFIALMILVYALQNFFVFDTVTTLWLFFGVFAATFARSVSNERTQIRISVPRILPPFIAVFILMLLYPVSIQPIRANLLLAQGYTYHIADVEKSISLMQKGFSLGTYADLEYGYQVYEMYTSRQLTMLSGEERVSAYRFALEILQKTYAKYPYDARTATYLAHILDSAPPEEFVDEDYKKQILARAIELSPKRAQAYYILANISLKKGDQATNSSIRNDYYSEAIKGLEEYAEFVPNFAEPRYIIANIYLALGDKESAKRWADEGLVLFNENNDTHTPGKAQKYYISTEDWPNALRFMQNIVNDGSDDYPQLYDLAKLYYLNGDVEHAKALVERIRREAPDLLQTDPAFLNAIGG